LRHVCLALLLLGALCGTSCRRDAVKGVYFDPAFAPLIPPDATMLAGVRLEKIRATPLYKKYQDLIPLRLLDQFKEETGLDPQRDIWEMVIARTPSDIMVFARGHFTVGELEPKLDPLGKNRVPYKGYTLVGNEQSAVTFLNPGVAAAGRLASLKAMIDRRNNPAAFPAALAARITTIPVDAQLWLVDSQGLPGIGLVAGRDDVSSILSNFQDYVSGLNMSAHIDEGIRYEALVDCKSDEGVKRLKDALRGVIGFARLSTKPDQQDMLRLYDAIEVTPDQKSVRVTASVSPELVPKLVGLAKEFRGTPDKGSPGAASQ